MRADEIGGPGSLPFADRHTITSVSAYTPEFLALGMVAALRAFSNLLNNAYEADGEEYVVVTVRDHGLGIPAAHCRASSTASIAR